MDAALRLPPSCLQGHPGSEVLLKACLGISVFGLLPLTAQVVAGNLHDMEIFPPLDLFRRGTLFLFDKGFVAYARLRAIAQARHFYLCPMRLNGNALVTRVNRGPAWLRKAVRKSRDGVWLKQHLSLEVLPSKDRHAVQIFAWASLIALALSRTVSGWLWPLNRTVGLASAIRPQLVTRAMRATLRILGRVMATPFQTALLLLRILADEILTEVRSLERLRPDSFTRIEPILEAG